MEKRYTDKIPAANILKILRGTPAAVASVHGNRHYPDIGGSVRFYRVAGGTLVYANITGLPRGTGNCDSPVFAFHLHEGRSCTGNAADPFADAGGHYNPDRCLHPYHAGDMPPLFCAGGRAVLVFLTDRFQTEEIIGKTVIIHSGTDDFFSQPAGGAGMKIACGTVRRMQKRM